MKRYLRTNPRGTAVLALDVRQRDRLSVKREPKRGPSPNTGVAREITSSWRGSIMGRMKRSDTVEVHDQNGRLVALTDESLRRLSTRMNSRAGLIEAAKAQITELCDALLREENLVNTFDVCML